VLATAVPQLLLYTGAGGAARQFFRDPSIVWPWTAAARLALGDPRGALVVFWIAAAYVFGRRQFRRSLAFDLAAVQSSASAPARSGGLYRLPSLLFRDPLGALLEKEFRTLARSPRFRLVFLMGFSFGFLIWLPMLRQEGFGAGVKSAYPVYVALYGMVLLAEVAVWNSFGFDRSAARMYFAAPLPLAAVLAAKNLATVAVVIVEALCIAAVCAVLPLGIPAARLVETFFVALVFSIYLTATGNLSSVYYPRPVNPEHSWGRQSGTRFQLYLLFLFPLLLGPVLLAYGARYAFASDVAFYATLLMAAVIGLIYYWVALDSAIQAADRRREPFLAKLSETSGPVASD
jgi:ABC-2 type transport system permease protein